MNIIRIVPEFIFLNYNLTIILNIIYAYIYNEVIIFSLMMESIARILSMVLAALFSQANPTPLIDTFIFSSTITPLVSSVLFALVNLYQFFASIQPFSHKLAVL